ncbi:reverse transcriptase domain-containing protein [Tanacetum coccineum]
MPVTRQGTNDAMTPESIQSMIDRAIQRNSTHMQDDASHNSGGGLKRPVQHARIEKMESVFHISGCAIENQVKFATCTLLGAALTWWNGHVRTLGHDAAYAMTWGTFKKKLTDKYCPNGEIKKLEIELWNLKVRGNDVAAYTQRFQELALMCTKFLADETAKIDKYIGGLPDNIHGNVMSARPKTLDFAIELANDLMDQKLRTYAERQNENKRKADDSSRNNHQQQPHKKQNVARAYTAGPGEKKAYTGDLPLCTDMYYKLAVRLQAQEQEELTVEEKSKLFVELMDKRKKHFARLRIDDDQEEAEMKRHMEIVVDEEEIAVDAIPLATKPPIILLDAVWLVVLNRFKTTMLKNFVDTKSMRNSRNFSEAGTNIPHHGFTELTQVDTFYNGLNDNEQDSLNAAAGGNLLSKTTREALNIIENKSKVRYSRNKPNASRMNVTSSKTDERIDKLADQLSTLVEIVSKKVVTPAP